MQMRRFSSDLKIKIPGNHPGLYGVLIQMNRVGRSSDPFPGH
jgi:hypothetical protein